MLGSTVLDVALGLVFVYWFFGSICSAVVELVASKRNTRSEMLKRALKGSLGQLGDAVLSHALVRPGKDSPATHIQPSVFADVLRDCASRAGGEKRSDAEVKKLIASIEDEHVREILGGLVSSAGAKAGEAEERVNRWFDHAMERLTEEYRKQARVWSLIVAFVVTVGFNVDTIYVAEALWASPALSAKIADVAQGTARSGPSTDATVEARVVELADLHKRVELPVGWSSVEIARVLAPDGRAAMGRKLLGLLITTFALTLGAPFWFEILKKLAGLRKPSAPPPAKS